MTSLRDVFRYDAKKDRLIWQAPPACCKRAAWLKERPAGSYNTSRGARWYYLLFNKKRYGVRELREIFPEGRFTKSLKGHEQ